MNAHQMESIKNRNLLNRAQSDLWVIFVRANADKLDWNDIRQRDLTLSFIVEFYDYLFPRMAPDLIEKNKSILNWDQISGVNEIAREMGFEWVVDDFE